VMLSAPLTTSAVFNGGQLAAKARAISALSQAEEFGGLGIGPSMGAAAPIVMSRRHDEKS
jgi:hypothetical protein